MYINKLDNIVNEYNNAYQRTIKIKPIDIKNKTVSPLIKKLMIKILNLKLVILQEYQNTKTFLLKHILEIGLKKFLWLKKLNILCYGHMLLMIIMVKKLLELFMKKTWKKQVNKNKKTRIENVIKKNENKLYVKWRDYDNSFNSGIDIKDIVKWIYKNESIFSKTIWTFWKRH